MPINKLLFEKPLFMGILNLTPDSFSDTHERGFAPLVISPHKKNRSLWDPRDPKHREFYIDGEQALKKIDDLKKSGTDIIDIGAESTAGPEAAVSADEEWKRLQPVLSRIDDKKTFVSVDTWKSEVAEKALKLGVQMINDVTAMRGDKKMIEVVLKYKPYVCLMHSAYKTPYAGQEFKKFPDIIATIKKFLKKQSGLLLIKGFPRDKIIIDPGLGRFLSNDPNVSWEVIDRLGELKELGFPILIGPSRKGFLGGELQDRDEQLPKIVKKCFENGANIVRLHNPKKSGIMKGILHHSP